MSALRVSGLSIARAGLPVVSGVDLRIGRIASSGCGLHSGALPSSPPVYSGLPVPRCAVMTTMILIQPDELAQRLTAGERTVLLDVRWALGDPHGREHYQEGHLPGAVFVDLDGELAAPATPLH